jgi:hypothetical protein
MDCRVGSRSSRRHSFPACNVRLGRQNTDRPVTRWTLCSIPVANSGRRGERERPETNQSEGTGDVLGIRLTRRSLYHRADRSESRILNSISQHSFRLSIPHSDLAVYRALCLGLSLKSCITLPRMCLGHTVKIANITDLSELEVGNPENDN